MLFICSGIGLMDAIEKILSLLKAEGIDTQNKDAVLQSLAETCLPTKLSKYYLEHIYNNDKQQII